MKFVGKFLPLMLAGVFALGSGMAQAAVQNGGFEDTDYNDLGNTVPVGWQLDAVDFGLIVSSYNPYGTVHGDVQNAMFQQSGSFASLSQSVATVVGQAYRLEFWLSSDGGSNQMQVSWGGQSLLNQSLSAFDWTRFSYTVTATAAQTVLSFASQNDGINMATYLDDVSLVSVSAVPEASSYAMLLAGLGLVGVITRRRRR